MKHKVKKTICNGTHKAEYVKVRNIKDVNGKPRGIRFRCSNCGKSKDVSGDYNLLDNHFNVEEIMDECKQQTILNEIDNSL